LGKKESFPVDVKRRGSEKKKIKHTLSTFEKLGKKKVK